MTALEVSTIVRNYVIAGATIFAGSWTFWKWGFIEWLRRRREGPAIDGVVEHKEVELPNNENLLITIEATWRNCSVYPVYIDTRKTRIDLFQLPSKIEVGPIVTNKDLGEPRHRLKPYEDMNSFILEPNTNSVLQHHFILKRNNTYLLRWKLYRNPKQHDETLFAWTKELVIKV